MRETLDQSESLRVVSRERTWVLLHWAFNRCVGHIEPVQFPS